MISVSSFINIYWL